MIRTFLILVKVCCGLKCVKVLSLVVLFLSMRTGFNGTKRTRWKGKWIFEPEEAVQATTSYVI